MPSDLTPEVRELLSWRNMAHVATLMRDGAPRVSPIWIAVEGDRLAIFAQETSLAIMDRMSNRYVGADFAVRSGVALLIEPESVHFQDLPFEHPAPPARR